MRGVSEKKKTHNQMRTCLVHWDWEIECIWQTEHRKLIQENLMPRTPKKSGKGVMKS